MKKFFIFVLVLLFGLGIYQVFWHSKGGEEGPDGETPGSVGDLRAEVRSQAGLILGPLSRGTIDTWELNNLLNEIKGRAQDPAYRAHVEALDEMEQAVEVLIRASQDRNARIAQLERNQQVAPSGALARNPQERQKMIRDSQERFAEVAERSWTEHAAQYRRSIPGGLVR